MRFGSRVSRPEFLIEFQQEPRRAVSLLDWIPRIKLRGIRIRR